MVLDQFRIEILQLWKTILGNEIIFWKILPSHLRVKVSVLLQVTKSHHWGSEISDQNREWWEHDVTLRTCRDLENISWPSEDSEHTTATSSNWSKITHNIHGFGICCSWFQDSIQIVRNWLTLEGSLKWYATFRPVGDRPKLCISFQTFCISFQTFFSKVSQCLNLQGVTSISRPSYPLKEFSLLSQNSHEIILYRMVMRPFYLSDWNSYTGKTKFFYWKGTQGIVSI